ncbi:MAG: rpsI [Solirubrobacteraceae bacterium]|nr:rpsI [Solirubrobacteraceae bacterium]
MAEDTPTNETPDEQPIEEAPVDEQNAAAEEAAAEAVPVPEEDVAEAEETSAEAAEEAPAEAAAEAPAETEEAPAEAPAAAATEPEPESDDDDEAPAAPREKPAIPGADLEVDLVLDGEDRPVDPYASYDEDGELIAESDEDSDGDESQPVTATIDLAADARYKATGKRKTAVARVILRPGTGAYTINGKPLDEYFPRITLTRQIRQPLEAVGYEDRMDVVARLHGSGVSAQAGALRHGISRALLDADPNLRGELKRRGFLTRDARSVERKKAGLKKARKKPQFSKR